MLFKAQLSASRLRANLEQEYQATINFVFKALLEVCSCLHDAVVDSGLARSLTLPIFSRLAKCQPLAFSHRICRERQAAALHLTVIFSYNLPDTLSMQTSLAGATCTVHAGRSAFLGWHSLQCFDSIPCKTRC